MSHKIIYVAIPSARIDGDTSKENIDMIAAEIMMKYVEDTADEDMAKVDWYAIGGRWNGSFATSVNAESAYLQNENTFTYTFGEPYNAVCNHGECGPYIVGTEEFVPVSGACIRDIVWAAPCKLDNYWQFKYLQMCLENDESIGNQVPEGFERVDDCIYFPERDHALITKKGDTFEKYVERLNIKFFAYEPEVDAFIDLDENWHDANSFDDIDELGDLQDLLAMGPNITDALYDKFKERLHELIESLGPDDYLLVIDGHAFP